MDAKEKEQLRQRYKALDNEAIIAIVSVDNSDYDPDALALAKAELQNRNITTQQQTQKAGEISNERRKEREEIEKKPLTKRQKILFTALPAWGIWYGAFIPKEYKRRRKDTNKAVWIGVALYWAIVLLIWILHKK